MVRQKTKSSKWTQFMDMHSGGVQKEKWAYIYIEAPEDEAKIIFYNKFGHNPERVTCTCCGEDYSISEGEDLAQLTAFERNCEYSNARRKYIEEQRESNMKIRERCNTPPEERWGLYVPLSQYLKSKDVLFIKKNQIKTGERIGTLPQQGYVWVD